MTLEFQNQINIQPTEEGGGGAPINNQNITITTNGTYTAEQGYTGIGTATVNVPSGMSASVSVEEE